MLDPQGFIQKWRNSTLTERSAAQSHFNDLCVLLGQPTPVEADPEGTWYTFEKGTKKTGGGSGWADVWKRGCFAWEYKGKHKDLNAALKQLQQYALALENPPLLIVSDMDTIVIHTNFTNTVHQVYTIPMEDLADPAKRQLLKHVFTYPEELKPGKTREALTAEAAGEFASLAQKLRSRGHAPDRVAHFLNKLLFCLFAEDIGILPHNLFTRLLETAARQPERFQDMAGSLFVAMRTGGFFGVDDIHWFNGGLFADSEAFALAPDEIQQLKRIARLDWSAIEPAIFGTLFERGLDPDKRSQLGAHYTDAGSIQRIIEPVVLEPLRTEWCSIKAEIATFLEKAARAKSASAATKARNQAESRYHAFLERLVNFRVLDPACGSGNFLYLALRGLKDLEHQVMLEAEALGLQRSFPQVGPEAVLGIEVNPYAAELARVTVWIGEIQWMLTHGYSLNTNPVLRNLDQISCRDALLNGDGSETEWPEANCIVGNPPFLGDKRMIDGLGEGYVTTLRPTFKGRVPGGADLVTYWFEKGRAQVEAGKTQRAGLVATNSIRGGANRKVLERIRETGTIFNAWNDEPWVNEGAAVRVSLVCFGKGNDPAAQAPHLNGQSVVEIYTDLTGQSASSSRSVDLTQAKVLAENAGISFIGTQKNGPFDITGDLARQWLLLPNPNERSNSDVLRPWANGMDVTRRLSDTWIIDFGVDMPEAQAAFYEVPFHHVVSHVKPMRESLRREGHKKYWWRYGETRSGMRRALAPLRRYIATPRVAKYRLFVWLDRAVLPDSRLYAIARDDDASFGILHSRIHEVWSLATCSWHGVGNDPTYNAHSCFETFPFPEGLTPNIPAAAYAADSRAQTIAEAARELVRLRDNWLNPPEWVKRVPEVVPGYPDRLIPVDEKVAPELKKRTLTNLYNARPAWLANAHRALDEAVAAAYGWEVNLSDDEVLRRLLELNQGRTT